MLKSNAPLSVISGFVTYHNMPETFINSVFKYKNINVNQFYMVLFGFHIDTRFYYNDVIMGAMASQITSLTIVYSAV